jgi:hypothetical protein
MSRFRCLMGKLLRSPRTYNRGERNGLRPRHAGARPRPGRALPRFRMHQRDAVVPYGVPSL